MKALFISLLLFLFIISTSNSRDDSYTQRTTRQPGLIKTERNFKKGRQRNKISNNVHHYSILMIQIDKTVLKRKRLKTRMGLAQNNCILGGYFCNHNNNWRIQKIEQSRGRQFTFKFGDSIKSPGACFNASFLFHSITFDLVQNIPISNMKLIRLKLLCVSLQSWQGDTTRCQPRSRHIARRITYCCSSRCAVMRVSLQWGKEGAGPQPGRGSHTVSPDGGPSLRCNLVLHIS